MKIDDISTLKKWIVRRIDDFCPTAEATSNYAITLLKKESTNQEELMEICKQSLATFLKDRTDDFVSDLFHTLTSGSYMVEDEDAVDYDDFDDGTEMYAGQRNRERGETDEDKKDIYSYNDEDDEDNKDERDWRRDRHKDGDEKGSSSSSSGYKRRADDDDSNIGAAKKNPRQDNISSSSSGRQQKPCFAFQRGECKRGDRCNYSHEMQGHLNRGAGSDRYNNFGGSYGGNNWGGGGPVNNFMMNPMSNPMMNVDPMMMMQMAGMGMMDPMMMQMSMMGGMLGHQQQFPKNQPQFPGPQAGGSGSFGNPRPDNYNNRYNMKSVNGSNTSKDRHQDDGDAYNDETEVVYSTIEERQQDTGGEEVYNEAELGDGCDALNEQFFTLKCTGVPGYVKEAELISHFATFGDLTEFKFNIHQPDESGEKKKVYNDCIVQFWEADDAERCLSSPKSVLNNRFIKISINDNDLVSEEDLPEYPKYATSKRDKHGRSLSKVPKKVDPAVEKAKQLAAGIFDQSVVMCSSHLFIQFTLQMIQIYCHNMIIYMKQKKQKSNLKISRICVLSRKMLSKTRFLLCKVK